MLNYRIRQEHKAKQDMSFSRDCEISFFSKKSDENVLVHELQILWLPSLFWSSENKCQARQKGTVNGVQIWKAKELAKKFLDGWNSHECFWWKVFIHIVTREDRTRNEGTIPAIRCRKVRSPSLAGMSWGCCSATFTGWGRSACEWRPLHNTLHWSRQTKGRSTPWGQTLLWWFAPRYIKGRKSTFHSLSLEHEESWMTGRVVFLQTKLLAALIQKNSVESQIQVQLREYKDHRLYIIVEKDHSHLGLRNKNFCGEHNHQLWMQCFVGWRPAKQKRFQLGACFQVNPELLLLDPPLVTKLWCRQVGLQVQNYPH